MTKKYTQEEAELMADWFNATNQLNTTANISDDIRNLFLEADKIRIKLQSIYQMEVVVVELCLFLSMAMVQYHLATLKIKKSLF